MTEEEEKLYEDNCRKKTCVYPWDAANKCSQCPRQMFASDTVCQRWKKWNDHHHKVLEGKEKLLQEEKKKITS